MRGRSREISVFSVSALDLFAAALGAFILIVLVLFPYYRMGGFDEVDPDVTAEAMAELEELLKRRTEAADTLNTQTAQIRVLEAEKQLLDKQYRSTKRSISEFKARIEATKKAMAEIEIPDPAPTPVPTPTPDPIPNPPQSTNSGVPFSILGLATNKKKFVVVVDMSGSMRQYSNIATGALSEILAQMKPDSEFAILGYQGGLRFHAYPQSGRLARANASTLSGAQRFVNALPRNFSGGTPTQNAMLRALQMNPEAIILLSDGEPTDGAPRNIAQNLTNRNRGRVEIHTVAIGDYTKNPNLTLFLQTLADRNRGDFVGLAR